MTLSRRSEGCGGNVVAALGTKLRRLAGSTAPADLRGRGLWMPGGEGGGEPRWNPDEHAVCVIRGIGEGVLTAGVRRRSALEEPSAWRSGRFRGRR